MKVILFGASGMVGQAVLRECLLNQSVTAVLSIGRRSSGQSDPKLRELILPDLFDLPVDAADFREFEACLFCLGVSSVGMDLAEYERLTFELTMGWAKLLARSNPKMTFIYVSGAGTGGKPKWAQIKGRTENELFRLFPSSYMIRLGAMRPMHGEVSKTRWTRIGYSIMRPLFPLVSALAPSAVITSEDLARGMINVAREGASKRVLGNKDLRVIARSTVKGAA